MVFNTRVVPVFMLRLPVFSGASIYASNTDNTYNICPSSFHTYTPEPPESDADTQDNVTETPLILYLMALFDA